MKFESWKKQLILDPEMNLAACFPNSKVCVRGVAKEIESHGEKAIKEILGNHKFLTREDLKYATRYHKQLEFFELVSVLPPFTTSLLAANAPYCVECNSFRQLGEDLCLTCQSRMPFENTD